MILWLLLLLLLLSPLHGGEAATKNLLYHNSTTATGVRISLAYMAANVALDFNLLMQGVCIELLANATVSPILEGWVGI